ncbi:MAG: 7-carboxy-7-deazaguanine synthase [Deltaproteobacteria bacterium HGW-Deltaproteobacteria-17]|nr:MAG: 7-carboxy-7-deazaguanine synthase [Deltaproteobacteria bacterium HGW-Deltaproteobacteria-17]
MTLAVQEIFFSLQGESTRAGLPCVFVRLAGCPLRCTWCDTEAVRTAPGRPMSVDDVLVAVAAHACPLVEVTGGEPLAQDGAPELLRALCDAGYTVLLETSGAFGLSGVPADVHVIMDVKPPSSGEQARLVRANFDRLGPGDEVKFVVADRFDFDYALEILGGLPDRRFAVLFSPILSRLDPSALAQWLLAARVMDARLQIQLHKLGHFA